jgi:hypothetical protein
MNKPELIKYLIEDNMSHKIICLITKSRQPYVSKVASGRLHVDAEASPNFDPAELARYNAIKKIYELKALPTQGITEDDEKYIHLLKYMMVDKDRIYEMYSDLSRRRFAMIYTSKKIDFMNFNASLLDISQDVFLDLFSQTSET